MPCNRISPNGFQLRGDLVFVFGLAVVVFMGELSIREGICVVCVLEGLAVGDKY